MFDVYSALTHHIKAHFSRLVKATMLLCTLTMTFVTLKAQSVEGWQNQQTGISRKGMYTLGGWALANISTSAVGMYRGEGVNYHFHQMNVAWNVVNLSLAGANLLVNKPMPEGYNEKMLLEKNIKLEKVFLFNTGLDVAYMTAGALLAQDRYSKYQLRNRGWGQSLMLQGAFLFVFDLYMHHQLKNLRRGHSALAWHVNAGAHGVALTIQF